MTKISGPEAFATLWRRQQERIAKSPKALRGKAVLELRAAHENDPPHIYAGRCKFCKLCGCNRLDFIHWEPDPKRPGFLRRKK